MDMTSTPRQMRSVGMNPRNHVGGHSPDLRTPLRFLGPMQWLSLLLALLSSLNGMAAAVDVTTASPIALTEQVEWCSSDAKLGIAEVVAGGCVFKPGNKAGMARGFSDRAFWLRLTLQNPAAVQTERWLRIGHSRLQQVSLFEPDAGGAWLRTDTGILTPSSKRPILATYPVLPLQLAANETRTVYVRVASESVIDLTPTLWTPGAFSSTHQRMDLSRTLSIGGLLATAFLSAMLFLRQREWAFLYFAGLLIFSALYDACYTGLLPAYLWPSDLPYEIRLQPVAVGLSCLCFVLFVRSFVRNVARYRINYLVMYFLTALTMLGYLWACLVNFRAVIALISLPHLAAILSGVVIFVRYWRDGSRAAGYILLSYSAIIPLILYRTVMEYGAISYTSSQTSISLALTLFTPTILIGIAAHSEALHAALLQSRADSNARMKFLAQMSHEFRTPLNTVLGYAELLLRGSARVSLHEGVAAIKNSSRHLLGMIDDILDQVRGESGQISLRVAPVHWGDFIQSLEQSASMMMQDRGNHFQLILEGEMPQAVCVDELRLQGVLNNLLSNANRYTQNGSITFTCRSAAVDSGHCRLTFTVSDTGQGIATDEQKRIFEPFVRGTAGKSSGIDGIGMGLVIAQQLVTLMGGEIRMDSQPGRGSRFYFSIVCELAEAAPRSSTVPEHAAAPRAHTILVVDDDENSRKLLAMLLADAGFIVATAKSGNDARQFLSPLPNPDKTTSHSTKSSENNAQVAGYLPQAGRAQRGGRSRANDTLRDPELNAAINLVITDQYMPDGDGWSVLKDWSARKIPLILLSAAPPDRPEDLPESLRFASVQLKPFDANTLLNAIGEILAVEWATTKAQIHDIRKDIIQRPPMELLKPLKAMIEQGAVTDITEWLEIFSAQHPQYAPYAARIATANLTLDFKELQKLTL